MKPGSYKEPFMVFAVLVAWTFLSLYGVLVSGQTSPTVTEGSVTKSNSDTTLTPEETTKVNASETTEIANQASTNGTMPDVTDNLASSDVTTVISLTEDVFSPRVNVSTPTENVTSPTENVTSPTVSVTTPTEDVISPTVSVTNPTEDDTSPTENVTTPTGDAISSRVNVTISTENVTSPQQEVTTPEMVDITTESTQSLTPESERSTTVDSISEGRASTENTDITSDPVNTTVSAPALTTTYFTEIDEHVLRPSSERADFVVLDDADRHPCLLASLNITFHFQYRVQEGLIRETYDTVSRRSANDDSSYTGFCQDNTSKLSICWNNNTFTLNLTFILHEQDPEGVDMDSASGGKPPSNVSSYTLNQVSLSYDTSNQDIFPGAFNPSQQTVLADNLNLFKTPYGMSYMCQTPEAVSIQFKDVDLVFNFVHLLPFGVESKYFTNDTVICSGDLSALPSEQESITTPIIVAAVLASVVVLIIIGYAIQRVVPRHLHQSSYKQMD